MTIDQQLESLRGKVQDHLSYIAAQEARYASFFSSSKRTCKGLPSKKRACETEKIKFAATAAGIKADIEARKVLIQKLNADIDAVIRHRDKEGEAIVILAQSGRTPASIQAQATADAEAAKESAKIVASAQANVITQSAETDMQLRQKAATNNMIAAIVVVVVVVIAIGLIRKFRK